MNTNLQPETRAAFAKIPAGCVNRQSAQLGIDQGEPLLAIADALLSYAKAYQTRFEGPISGDAYAHQAFADLLAGVKTLLDMDGGVALRRGITTDSKDNRMLSDVLEAACVAGGFKWEDL
jgi:hypothetical protein